MLSGLCEEATPLSSLGEKSSTLSCFPSSGNPLEISEGEVSRSSGPSLVRGDLLETTAMVALSEVFLGVFTEELTEELTEVYLMEPSGPLYSKNRKVTRKQ